MVERLESIRNCFIIRRQEDSRHKQLDSRLTKSLAISYEKHLTNLGIHPDYYDKVYELATLLYNEKEIKGPFGVDEIVQGAMKFKEINQPPKVSSEFKLLLKERSKCDTCKGTGLIFDKGKIRYDSNKKAVKCGDCYEN